MRSTIVAQYLAEGEARPDATYSRLRDLAIASAKKLLADEDNLIAVDCPACSSLNSNLAFERAGYNFWECTTCGTIYVSPRPATGEMNWYLLHSPLAEFRNSQIHDSQIEDFTYELVRGRADWIVSLSHWPGTSTSASILLYQGRHRDLASILAQRTSSPVIDVMPLWNSSSEPGQAVTTPGTSVANDLKELSGTGAKLIMGFDCLEHISDVNSFFVAALNALEQGGLLALTTRAGSGFDIQALWDRLDTIFPLEHINLLSVDGMRILADRHGFDIVELSTPGQLDVQVVARVLGNQQEWRAQDRVLRLLVMDAGKDGRNELQQFLQKHLLSSHMWVVARKRS